MTSFALSNGQVFVVAEAAGGVYNSEQLKVISDLAAEDASFIKVSEDQRLGLVVDESLLPKIQDLFASVGLLLRGYQRAQGAVPTPKACLGELCPHHEQDALGDSLEVFRHWSDGLLPAPWPAFVAVGLNGCSRACAASATDDIHVVGDPTGYKIAIGGRTAELPQLGRFLADNVSKDNLPAVLSAIINKYFELKEEGDSCIFDVIERCGTEAFSDSFSELTGVLLESLEALPEPESLEAGADALDVLPDSLNGLPEPEGSWVAVQLPPELQSDDLPDIPDPTPWIDEQQQAQSAFLEGDLGDIELESADASALDSITQKLQEEAQFVTEPEPVFVPSVAPAPEPAFTDPPLSAPYASPALSAPQEAPQSTGRRTFGVKCEGPDLVVTLSSGATAYVPLDALSDGETFVVELGQDTLEATRLGQQLDLKCGRIKMKFAVPSDAASSAVKRAV